MDAPAATRSSHRWIEAELDAFQPAGGSKMEIQDLRTGYERWLVATQDLSAHTVRAYVADVSALERFLGPGFNPKCLEGRHLYDFVEQLSADGLSSVSLKRRMSGVRRFCQWLCETGVLGSSPTEGMRLRFSRPRRLPRAVSTNDIGRLLRHLCDAAEVQRGHGPSAGASRPIQTTTLLAVALMIATGMRVGELVNVELRHVNLPSRTILVVGKGQRERVVFLSNDWIVRLIQMYVAERGDCAAVTEPLLVNRSGNPLTTASLRSRLSRAANHAGLPTPVTPHMLRHTAATQLIEAGVDIRFVQRLLGHASLTTTEIYTHVADTSLHRAVTEADVLGRALMLR